MDSPERVLSKMEPKYVTLEYCFILMPLYWMFSGLDFLILSVYSYHVTYAFQSESTLYNCLNIEELVTWSRSKIWSLSDCNWTQTQNHLVFKRRYSTIWPNWPNDWAVLWVLICTVQLTASSYHVKDSSIIWSVWTNGWVFVYKLSGSGFESSCSQFLILCLLPHEIDFALSPPRPNLLSTNQSKSILKFLFSAESILAIS